jgi:hypothetical protein
MGSSQSTPFKDAIAVIKTKGPDAVAKASKILEKSGIAAEAAAKIALCIADAVREARENGKDVDAAASAVVGGCSDCGGKGPEHVEGGFYGGIYGGIYGGASANLGSITDYANSQSASAKNRIIEDILKVAQEMGLKISGDSPTARISSLAAQVPSPESYKPDHEKVCRRLAKKINEVYGSEVINPGVTPVAICEQVVEVLHSLRYGMQSEFLTVFKEVQSVVKNLKILQDSLEQQHKKSVEKLSGSDDAGIVRDLAQLNELHVALTGELKRQLEMLNNLLSLRLSPTAGDLAELLRKSDHSGHIKVLKDKPTSDRFGTILHNLMKGLGVTAAIARKVDMALKDVGMKVDDYKRANSLTALKAAIMPALVAAKDSELHDKLSAFEFLTKNFDRKEDILRELEQQKSMSGGTHHMSTYADEAAGSTYGGSYGNEASGSLYGGADVRKTLMQKRVEDHKTLRNVIFSTFFTQVNKIFDQFVGSVDSLSRKVGKEVPLSDALDSLRNLLARMNESLLRNRNIYYALTGYYNDALSKSQKDSFLADLRMISSQIDAVLEMPMYASSAGAFKDVQAQIRALGDIIGRYSEDVAAKFGNGERAAVGGEITLAEAESALIGGTSFSPANAAMLPVDPSFSNALVGGDVTLAEAEAALIGGCGECDKKDGGDDDSDDNIAQAPALPSGGKRGAYDMDSFYGGDEPKLTYKTSLSISNAIRRFDYNYRVAQILKNLSTTSKELAGYGQKQEKIVAHSIADILGEQQKMYQRLRKELDAQATSDLVVNATCMPDAADASKEKVAALAVLDAQWEAKKKFWSTVEAIDSYMRQFTDAIIKSPQEVREIQSMLEDIETISDWYSNKSGEILSNTFEQFPATVPADTANMPANVGADDSSHYYSRVSTATSVGNPDMVTMPSKGKAARDSVKKMFTTMAALKNLMSVFVQVGSHFNGEELRKKVFMNPAQIYNNLVEYLQASAFAQGYGIGAVPTDDTTMPATFNDASNMATAVSSAGFAAPVAGTPSVNHQLLFKKRWGVWMRSVDSTKRTMESFGFNMEDDYFVMVLKSIAAKVLTVTGLYDVLDRPHEYNGLGPIRMILGGADDMPKVEEGAVALYLRLPLLCQFYRQIFGFDIEGFETYNQTRIIGKEALKISMVPDLDGTFSGLIRLIFREVRHVNTAEYTDEDVKAIIRECNLIYQRMSAKYPQNTVGETIQELIAEVNRRYGIVSQIDRNAYESDFDRAYSYSDRDNRTGAPDSTEYAILPGEEIEEIERMSPSAKLLGETFTAKTPAESKYTITKQHRDLMYRFRCALDKHFESPDSQYTFNHAIRSTIQKLKGESRDLNRFKMAAALIRGIDVQAKVDGMKYLLFQDTVVGGLNVLSGLHTLIARFQQRAILLDTDFLIAEFVKHLASVTGGAVQNTASVANGMWTNISRDSKVFHDQDIHSRDLLQKILGEHEDAAWNGGSGAAAAAYDLRQRNGVPASGIARIAGLTVAGGVIGNATGLSSLLNGINVGDLVDLFKGKGSKDSVRKVRLFFRFLFNTEAIMQELLESVYALGLDCQELVQVSLNDGHLNVTFGGLKNTVRDIFSSVGYYLDLLRPHINKTLIDQYTDKMRAGSFYWLQEQLMEKIIVGRRARGSYAEYKSLEEVSRSVANTYTYLTSEFEDDGAGLAAVSALHAARSRNSFGRLLTEMVFYDGAKAQSGLYASSGGAATANAKAIDFVRDPYEALTASGAPGTKQLDTRYAARFYQLYSWKDELTFNRSALYSFNQLVAKFVQTFFDPVSSKIYLPLIGQFANGVFARSLADIKHCYPDIAPCVQIKFGAGKVIPVLPTGALRVGVTDAQFTALKTAILAAAPFNDAGVAGAAKAHLNGLAPPLPVNPGTGVNATWNSVVDRAVAANPYSGNWGTAGSVDRDNRAGLLAALILRLGSAATSDDVSKILQLLRTPSSIPAGSSTSPITAIPQADFLSINTGNLDTADASGLMNEQSLLLLARTTSVANAMGANSIADLGAGAPPAAVAFDYGNRIDPTPETVLFASLAMILRNLTSTKTPTCPGCSIYAIENVAELPQYMKEKMRANLPQFRNLFRELITRCEFIKKVAVRPEVDMSRQYAARGAVAGVAPAYNPFPFNLAPIDLTSAGAKNRVGGILDNIIRGAQALAVSCEQALKEVGDEPKYFEMYQGSIRDYKLQNGCDPLSPLSTTLVALKNVDSSNYFSLFPIHSLGEEEFKWAYGTRGLLGDCKSKPLLDLNPGFASTIEGFNLLVGATAQSDKTRAKEFLEAFARGIRFVFGAKHQKGLLTSYVLTNADPAAATDALKHIDGMFSRDDMVVTNQQRAGAGPRAGVASTMYAASHVIITNKSDVSLSLQTDPAVVAANPPVTPVFAIAKTLSESIRLTESSDHDARLSEFIGHLTAFTPKSVDLAIQNIIDLNVIPINVHALMREIPLATLYNYSYTFDRMIVELYYGLDNVNAKKLISEMCGSDESARGETPTGLSAIKSAKDALVALLINPYMDIAQSPAEAQGAAVDDLYQKYVKGMLLGVDGSGDLGRPKFLSDQVYGKAIFGEVYQSPADYNEMGPAAAQVVRGVVSRDAAVNAAAADLVVAFGAAPFNGVIAPGYVDLKNKFAKAIIGYVYDYPTGSGDHLTSQIRTKMLGTGKPYNILAVTTDLAPIASIYGVVLGNAVKDIRSRLNSGNTIDAYTRNIEQYFTSGAVTGVLSTHIINLLSNITDTPTVPATGPLVLNNLRQMGAGVRTGTRATAEFSFTNRNVLHYLDTVDVSDYAHPGVGLEPDNENVLDSDQVKSVNVAVGTRTLDRIGRARFDTVLVRNLVFIINLYRSLRMKLARDLTYNRDIITRAAPITASRITELFGNSVYSEQKPYEADPRFNRYNQR